MAALYNAQLEFDKEWDAKLARGIQEIRAYQEQLKGRQAKPPAPPPPPPPPPAPPAVPAPAPAAPATAPAPITPPPKPAPVPEPAAQPAPAAPVAPAAKQAASAAVAAVEKPEAPAPAAEAAAAPAAEKQEQQQPAAAAPKEPEGVAAAARAAAAAPPDAAGAILDAAAAGAKEAAAREPSAPAAPAPSPAPAPAPTPAPVAATSTADASAAAVTAIAVLQPDSAPAPPLPPGLPAGSLGLGGWDLSAAGLLRHAVAARGGQGAAQLDWAQWPERHAQAVADSRRLFEALVAAGHWHGERMEEARAQLAAANARSEQLQAAGEAAVARFKGLLRQLTETSRELLELEVRQAEKRTALAGEAARRAEAATRGSALEQLRTALGALSMAHEARVRQAAASQTGHALAAGAAAVAAAAEGGAPLAAAAAPLAPLAAGPAADPLVGAVLQALPTGPVANRSQLAASFRALRRDLSALAALPEERTGLVAVAVARLGAWLKADESKAVRALGEEYGPGGVDAALARTEALLAAGQLPAAAEVLRTALAGTAAAALAADWVAAARERAAAEAAAAALGAHAAATWASLA